MRTPLDRLKPIRFEVASEVLCTRCHDPLERHQPDHDRPERLLGTCGGCGAWYVISLDAELMIALPDWLTQAEL